MRNDLFSVIVPVFNAERTIEKCIKSILSQTYSTFELLLVDDGSTDCSFAICKKFAEQDSRVHIIKKENGGVSSARNAALRAASGEWCVFVDSDDWCEPNHLEFLATNSADITYIGYRSWSENGDELPGKVLDSLYADGDKYEKAVKNLVCEKNFFAIIWSKKFKFSIIKEHSIAFDEDISICEDVLFTHTYLQYANSVSIIKEQTYNYLVRTNSLSHGGASLQNRKTFLEKYIDLFLNLKYGKDLKVVVSENLAKMSVCLIRDTFNSPQKQSYLYKKDIICLGIKIKYNLHCIQKKYHGHGYDLPVKNFFVNYAFCTMWSFLSRVKKHVPNFYK